MKKFDQIRFALEEHLSAINENTSEIQSLFDYLHEMEIKIDKVTQRLDQMQLNQDNVLVKSSLQPLDNVEKKIFLVLYTEESPLSFDEICRKTNYTLALVQEAITTISNKGIPLSRSHFNNKMFVKLDPDFKEMQAKQNLVNLSLQSFIE